MEGRYALGFDFGTESVRVLVARLRDGYVAGQASHAYPHGVINTTLPTGGAKLPVDYALQDSRDWLESASAACKEALLMAGIAPADLFGIGVAFTSCTMLPCRIDGTPLHTLAPFADVPPAWPKLEASRRQVRDRSNQ